MEKKSHEKHPWRKCSSGYHWRQGSYVDKHLREGKVVSGHYRKGACAKNPSHKDQIYPGEMDLIAKKYFNKVKNKPSKDDLGFKLKGTKYDDLIAGWTQYWNEVFKPVPELDPNFVKALMASESGFRSSIVNYANKKSGYARGLLQVMDETITILKDEKGELLDYLVNVTQKDMLNPNLNIAAGVRWLMRKKEIADWRLKRPATWMEVMMEYKGVLAKFIKNKSYQYRGIDNFKKNYERLKNEKN